MIKPLQALDDLITGKVFDGPKKKKGGDDGDEEERDEEVSDDDGDEEDEDDEDDEQPRKQKQQRPAVDVTINHVFSGQKPGGKRKRAPELEPDAADPAEEDGETEGK